MSSILIYIDSMATGGAARVASILMQGLSTRGYDIALETDLAKGIFYTIPDNIRLYPRYNIIGKNIVGKILYRLRLWRRHRKTFMEYKPDIVIAFTHKVFFDTWVSTCFLRKVKIIASDHTSMNRDLGPWQNFIRQHLYSLADAVTILTDKDRRLLGKKIPRKIVVPNPLSFSPVSDKDEIARRKVVLVAGRIDSWDVKGFDRIIEIWGRVSPDYPDWTLEIAGPGSNTSLDTIKKFASEAGVSQTMVLKGYRPDIQNLYHQASIFALPSRVEGFPMVLVEAMSQGCACISFSLDGAIPEIITDGEDGLIVADNDMNSFEKGLRRLLDNDSLRQQLSTHATETVSRFSSNCIIDKWETIIHTVESRK